MSNVNATTFTIDAAPPLPFEAGSFAARFASLATPPFPTNSRMPRLAQLF